MADEGSKPQERPRNPDGAADALRGLPAALAKLADAVARPQRDAQRRYRDEAIERNPDPAGATARLAGALGSLPGLDFLGQFAAKLQQARSIVESIQYFQKTWAAFSSAGAKKLPEKDLAPLAADDPGEGPRLLGKERRTPAKDDLPRLDPDGPGPRLLPPGESRTLPPPQAAQTIPLQPDNPVLPHGDDLKLQTAGPRLPPPPPLKVLPEGDPGDMAPMIRALRRRYLRRAGVNPGDFSRLPLGRLPAEESPAVLPLRDSNAILPHDDELHLHPQEGGGALPHTSYDLRTEAPPQSLRGGLHKSFPWLDQQAATPGRGDPAERMEEGKEGGDEQVEATDKLTDAIYKLLDRFEGQERRGKNAGESAAATGKGLAGGAAAQQVPGKTDTGASLADMTRLAVELAAL